MTTLSVAQSFLGRSAKKVRLLCWEEREQKSNEHSRGQIASLADAL